MSFARLRFHALGQGHNQGSKISLRGLQGHLLHTVTFLVSFLSLSVCYFEFNSPLRQYFCLYRAPKSTELQIREGIEDNSKIFFLFLNENICCDPSLETSQ